MAERGRFEPIPRVEAKSFENVDLVDSLFLGTGDRKQRVAVKRRQKRNSWQPGGNLEFECARVSVLLRETPVTRTPSHGTPQLVIRRLKISNHPRDEIGLRNKMPPWRGKANRRLQPCIQSPNGLAEVTGTTSGKALSTQSNPSTYCVVRKTGSQGIVQMKRKPP